MQAAAGGKGKEAAAAAAKDRALQEDEAQVTELSTRVQQLHDELRVARQAAEGTVESSAVVASAEAAMESWRRRAMEAEGAPLKSAYDIADESALPIDIPCAKLLSWLVDRRRREGRVAPDEAATRLADWWSSRAAS